VKRALGLLLLSWPATSFADAGAPVSVGGCVEHVPAGKPRPELSEKFPEKALAGHATELEVVVSHGKGETVLPHGLRIQMGGDEARGLERAGFAIPDPDGGAGPTLSVVEEGERARTTLRIPVVPLPEKPGLQPLTLPPLPIAISRASGELITVCTRPHQVLVDEPIADTPEARPKHNPEPRRQIEEWTVLKHVSYAALIALLVGALVAWLVGRWLRRPKPVPPPPPPRPPWEVALEELEDVRRAELIESSRFVEHYDRVSHIIRKYCGDRYGFDGLESTTREMLAVLRRVVPPIPVLGEIERFLRHADLVKFARLTPTGDECLEALERGERIVHATIPAPMIARPAPIPPGKERPPEAPAPGASP
jgi:hypothetical protein